jgi:hypothetical protein
MLALSMLEISPETDSRVLSGRTCPRCGEAVYRVRRRWSDRLASVFHNVRRYRCLTQTCGWEGLLNGTPRPASFRARITRLPVAWIIAGMLSISLVVLLAGIYLIGEGAWPSLLDAEGGQPEPAAEAASESTDGNLLEPTDPRNYASGPLDKPRRGCVWAGPGQRPYLGTLVDALTAAQLPSSVVGKFAIMRERGIVTDRLEISGAGIHTGDFRRNFGYTAKAMALGRTVCFDTRINVPIETLVAADLYELVDGNQRRYAIMIVSNGGNVAVLEEHSIR